MMLGLLGGFYYHTWVDFTSGGLERYVAWETRRGRKECILLGHCVSQLNSSVSLSPRMREIGTTNTT